MRNRSAGCRYICRYFPLSCTYRHYRGSTYCTVLDACLTVIGSLDCSSATPPTPAALIASYVRCCNASAAFSRVGWVTSRGSTRVRVTRRDLTRPVRFKHLLTRLVRPPWTRPSESLETSSSDLPVKMRSWLFFPGCFFVQIPKGVNCCILKV